MEHKLLARRRLHTHRLLLSVAVLTSAPTPRFWRTLALAVLLAVPLVARAQSKTTSRELNAILQSTATTKANSVVEVQFRNLGPKEIMGFRYSRVDGHANGTQVAYKRAGGADFVGSVAQSAALGLSLEGGRLRPGDTFSLTINPPAAPDGSPVVLVDVAVTALTFADRTALGDPTEIKTILSGRRQDAQRADAGLAEARAFLAGPDPRVAVDAQLVKIRQNGTKPASLGFLQMLSHQLTKDDPALVQKLLASWQARRQALIEHSTIKGEK